MASQKNKLIGDFCFVFFLTGNRSLFMSEMLQKEHHFTKGAYNILFQLVLIKKYSYYKGIRRVHQ